MSTIKIDNKEYKLEDLSDEVKAKIASLQVADQKINQLNQELALVQTARNAYSNVVGSNLPKPAKADKKNDTIDIDGKKYAIEDFSDLAKNNMASIQITDQKLTHLKTDIAIMQTARNAYAQAVSALLKDK